MIKKSQIKILNALKAAFIILFLLNAQSVMANSKLLVVDPTVPDFEQLIANLPEDTHYLVLNYTDNAFIQIANQLDKKQADSIHILSHAEPGSLTLAGESIDAGNLKKYDHALNKIKKNISGGTDILFYGCDLAATDSGKSLLSLIADKTGADVAASVDKTGHSTLGGDWDLEYKVGHVEEEVLIAQNVQNSYLYTLSHWRGGSISWTAIELDNDGLKNDIEIVVKTACALNNNGCAPSSLTNPDGITALTLTGKVTTNLTNYTFAETTFTGKNLDPDTTYFVYYGTCCRISQLKNNSNGYWKIQSNILMKDGNLAPKIDLPILYEIPMLDENGNAASSFSFPVSATDPNADTIVYRLATEDELGGTANGYTNPVGMTINANSGVVTWDFTALPASPQGLYSVGFVAEDVDISGNAKSKSHVDLILDLQNKQGVIYVADASIPDSRNVIVAKGTSYSFSLTGKAVNVTSLGQLDGALTEPSEGNFTFTPGNVGDAIDLTAGTYPLTFEVRDTTNTFVTSYLILNFIVPDPNGPKITNIEGDLTSYSSTYAQQVDKDFNAVVTDLDNNSNTVNHLNNGFIKFNITSVDGQYEILDIKSDGTGTGQISRVDYDVFYEGNKIGDVSSLEDGIGQALRIDFGTASIDAVQALVRNLTYADTFVIRSSGQRSMSLIIQDSDGLNTSYSINVSVNDHPDRPATGPPILVNNKLTIESGASKSIASNNIKFADADNVAADLIITVSAVTHGQFEYIANGGVKITTFTQEDINNGLIQFVHDASSTIPSYQLTVTDPSSNVFGPSLAAINFANGSIDNLNIYENKIGVGIISNANITGSTTYSITGGADSSSFTINASSGSLTFITAPDYETDAHSYLVEITVIGSSSGTDVRTVNVLLQDINESPTISGTNPTNTLNPRTPDRYSFTPVATDPENSALTFSIENKPDWASFNASTGELTITDPSNTIAAADAGLYSDIQITVNDGINSASLSAFFINVLDNATPVANPQTGVLTDEDTATSITLSATDADNDALTYTIVSTPTNGALTGTAPNLTYTPNANYFGSDSFSIKVNDGTADSNTATITITVADINDLPTVSSQSVNTLEDNALAIVLAATDSDGLIVSYTVNSPSNGLLTGSAPNLTYTPDVNFSGIDSFTYSATDDDTGESLPTTVSIIVTNINDAPVIAGTPATTIAEDTPYSFTATATDDDDGDTLV
ncbi:MAG: hypothetical protein ACI9VT_003069, partial [Psychroserpens sp.]